MVLGFVFRNVEDGKYGYFYAHENLLLLERSEHGILLGVTLECGQFDPCETGCTREVLEQLEGFVCYERDLFAALLKSVAVDCKHISLAPHLVKRADVNCLI